MPLPTYSDGIRIRMVEAMKDVILNHTTVTTVELFAKAIGTTGLVIKLPDRNLHNLEQWLINLKKDLSGKKS